MLGRGTEAVRMAIALLVLAAAVVLAASLVAQAGRLKQHAMDLAEIHDVSYGLLDADIWAARISAILDRRIDEFELTEQNKPQTKRNIERVLDRLLVEIDAYQRRQNQQGGSWLERIRGTVRQGVRDMFLDLDDLREKVPLYAEKILEELSKPESKADIKQQLKASIGGLANATFARTDRTAFRAILAEYGCADAALCGVLLQSSIDQDRQALRFKTVAVIAAVVLLFVLVLARSPGFTQWKMLLLTLAPLVLLAGGVLTPMIEIEAKISQLRLELLGEPVLFENQVLYFQSKSLMDVVQVLAQTGEPDMILVGALIALFSVAFPLMKVVASLLYFQDFRGWRDSALVRFFALKSGKWSMADVMVVTMLMAFIGFRGLVESQLANLARTGKAVEVLTTNGTSLQAGFYLFLAFCIAGLVLSAVLDQRFSERHLT